MQQQKKDVYSYIEPLSLRQNVLALRVRCCKCLFCYPCPLFGYRLFIMKHSERVTKNRGAPSKIIDFVQNYAESLSFLLEVTIKAQNLKTRGFSKASQFFLFILLKLGCTFEISYCIQRHSKNNSK